jgi:hypothetical protein
MDILIGELLVFALLVPVTLRPFSVKIQSVQSIAVLPAIALFCAFLLIIGNGLSLVLLLTFAVSLLFFLSHIPSLYRFASGIPTEWFGSGSKIYTAFLSLILTASIAAVWMYRPETLPLKNFREEAASAKVTEATIPLTGSFQAGFSPKKSPGEPTAGIVYIWQGGTKTVLYLPGAGASMKECRITAQLLASEGFTVIGADFYQSAYLEREINHPVIRSFCLRFSQVFPWLFAPLPEDDIIREKTRELTALAELVSSGPLTAAEDTATAPFLLFAEGYTAASAAETFRLLNPLQQGGSAFYILPQAQDGSAIAENSISAAQIQFGTGGIASWAGMIETFIVEGSGKELFGMGNIGILQPLDALVLGGGRDREGQQALMEASLAGRYFLRRSTLMQRSTLLREAPIMEE